MVLALNRPEMLGWLGLVFHTPDVFARPTIWPIDCQIEMDGNDIITSYKKNREKQYYLNQQVHVSGQVITR